MIKALENARVVVGLVAGLITLAGGTRALLALHDQSVRKDALLVQQASILRQRDKQWRLAENARLAALQASARMRDSLARVNVASMAKDSALGVLGARLDMALRARLPVDLRPALDSLQAVWVERMAEKDSVIGRQELALRSALRDEAGCEQAAASLRTVADQYKASAEAWQRRAEPGVLKKVLQGIPYFVAGGATTAGVVVVLHGG